MKYRGGERLGIVPVAGGPAAPIPPSSRTSPASTTGSSPARRRSSGAAVVPRVPPRRGVRRPQRRLRLRLPQREPRPRSTTRRSRARRLHRPARAAGGLARRAQRAAADARALLPHAGASRPTARSPMPRRAPRSSTGCSTSAAGSASLRSATCTRPAGARAARTTARSALADDLPHAPGVYLFRGRDGRVLYVGKSNDLRARVKSYFYGDGRKKIEDLLDEVRSVDGVRCAGELEALVLEARLIRRHEPQYNRRGKTWRRDAYLKLDPARGLAPAEGRARVKPGDGAHLPRPVRHAAPRAPREGGPRGGRADPPLHHLDGRRRPGSRRAPSPTWAAALAPCDGRTDPERYGELVR